MSLTNNKTILLMGPTASSKTDLSIFLAKKMKAEIINLDSAQIYHELNIGSAKPSKENLTDIPHHLVNIASIATPLNSYDIFKKSYDLIKNFQSQKKSTILTGGTGLYYKNLLYGMFEGPPCNTELREKLKQRPVAELYQELKEIDPLAAERIHLNDYTRIERALEVFYQTNIPLTELQKEQVYSPPADFILIGITFDREILYERINQRVDIMIKEGLIEEVQSLYKKYPQSSLLKKVIGYKEVIDFLDNQISLAECIDKIKQNSRRFAKRQLTLFNKIEGVKWFNPPHQNDIWNYLEKSVF